MDGRAALDSTQTLKASHGHPPDEPGAFFAWGDGMAPAGEVERIDAIDVHPTVTELLGIEPGRPVDGEAATAFLAG